MADNTTLDLGVGGDTIRTDDVGTSKIQVVKLATGPAGRDDGLVGDKNPLPVRDTKVLRELERMNETLDEILAELRNE